jgi:DNA-binding beta-propeller fold protein YncE
MFCNEKTMIRKKYIVITGLLALIFSGCRKEGPVDDNVTPPKSDYYLYAGGWSGDKIYIIDTDSNAVVDSIQGFMREIWSFVVTQSGRKMYVAAKAPINPGGISPGSIYSVDLKTHSVRSIFNEVADLYVAPNGVVFIITSYLIEGVSRIGVIDTLLDQVTFFDTLNIRDRFYGYDYQNVVFDVSRNLMYGINREHKLFAYDYVQKKVVRVYPNVDGFYFLQMVISHDGRYLFVAGGPVLDLEHGLVVSSVVGNYLGSLAISNDGQYLYVTDPGKYMIPEPPPSGKVRVYGTQLKDYIGEINICYPNYCSTRTAITDHIVLQPPDEKRMFVSNWLYGIFIVDVFKRQTVGEMFLPTFTLPLAIGRKQ